MTAARPERTKVLLGFAVISLIWGSTWLAIKIGLESVPPFFGLAIRFTVALAILLFILRLRGLRIPFDRGSVFVYSVLAVFSFSFPFALVYWSEQFIPSGLTAVLFGAFPFVVALLSHFALAGERLNAFKAAGILLGFSGVITVFWPELAVGGSSAKGMAAVLLSTVLQGISLVTMKKRGTHIDPVIMNAGGILFGLAIMYGLAFAFEDMSDVHLDARGTGTILYLGSFGTVVTFVVYYWLLKRVEAVYMSFTSLVTPVLAVALGAAVLGETLAPRVFAGAALVCTGILVANGRDVLALVRAKTQASPDP